MSRLPRLERRWLVLATMTAALLMLTIDVTVVRVALPSIQREPRDLGRRRAVGRQRLPADVGGVRDRGRPRRRPLRPPPRLPRRPRVLHGLLGARRARAGLRTASGLAGGAGCRSGRDAARHLRRRHRCLRRAVARACDGRDQRGRGDRRLDRPAARRRDHRVRRLALDLLRQRPDRAGCRRRRAGHRAGVTASGRAAGRRAGPRPPRRRADRADARRHADAGLGLDIAGDDRAPGGRGGHARALRAGRATHALRRSSICASSAAGRWPRTRSGRAPSSP